MNHLSSCRLSFVVPLALAVAVALPITCFANVYPTNLGQSASSFSTGQNVTLSYLLNENATGGVTVSILNSSNSVVRTITGGTSTGINQVLWDGKDNSNVNLPAGDYSFRVTSTGDTRSDWALTSTDSVLANFELPRGVAVNKNPDSAYYGRVYVSNPRTSPTVAGRQMGDGLYMLNADLSDTGIAGGTGHHTGGVDWLDDTADSGGVSPFRLEVGPDDSVYITDWSDAHSGLWQAPPDLGGSWTEVLDSSDRDSTGLSSVHGSIVDVVVVGTGENRRIYTSDEDIGTPGSIIRYDIGTETTFTEPAGTTERSGYLFNNLNSNPGGSGNWNINLFNSLAIDKRGDFWYSQNRSNGTDLASLVRIGDFDPDTGIGTINWDSLTALGNPDPLRGIQGIAYDPVNDVLALATNTGGNIIIFDPNTQTVLTQFAFGATTNTDMAFDNAGNLYVGNRSAEYVRVWSPPNGGNFIDNVFSTNSLAPLGAISLSVGVGLPGDFNSDGKVDASDYVVWRKSGNSSLPNDNGAADSAARYSLWRANFGNPPGSGAGLDGTEVPEPMSLGLLLVAVAGSGLLSHRVRQRD